MLVDSGSLSRPLALLLIIEFTRGFHLHPFVQSDLLLWAIVSGPLHRDIGADRAMYMLDCNQNELIGFVAMQVGKCAA